MIRGDYHIRLWIHRLIKVGFTAHVFVPVAGFMTTVLAV